MAMVCPKLWHESFVSNFVGAPPWGNENLPRLQDEEFIQVVRFLMPVSYCCPVILTQQIAD